MIPLITLTTAEKVFSTIVAIIIIAYWVYMFFNDDRYEWFSQNVLPENPRDGRNISEDVLVYDYDDDCNHIAFYSYSKDNWVFINCENSIPKNFKWRYFDIEIDQP
jgi:hypothetical protein